MAITDKFLMDSLKNICAKSLDSAIANIKPKPDEFEHPLDSQVLSDIESIANGIGSHDDEYRIFYSSSKINSLGNLPALPGDP